MENEPKRSQFDRPEPEGRITPCDVDSVISAQAEIPETIGTSWIPACGPVAKVGGCRIVDLRGFCYGRQSWKG